LKQFKLLKHPSGQIEAVKQGWSWPAFLFNWAWAFVKKLWAIGAGVGLGLFVLGAVFFLMGDEDGILGNIMGFVVMVVFGVNGNQWREKGLASRGFEVVDAVTASNSDGAIALHLKADGQAPSR